MKIEDKYPEHIIERGEEYLNSVKDCVKINNFIYGNVQGSAVYKTEVDLNSLDGDCSCPYKINCKHAVALYLNYKKGKFWDAKDFIKSLDKMNTNELKELILSKLQDNPDWIVKYNLRKGTNKKSFIGSFKKSFSLDKVNEAETLLPDFSFEQLLELQDYIHKNYDNLSEKLGEEKEKDNYEYASWDDEEYDEELLDLNDKLIEIIVKKSIEGGRAEEIINKDAFTDEIIANADSFLKFKGKIKKVFPEDKFLEFLLSTKTPDISELQNSINESNKGIVYDFIKEKPKTVKGLAKLIGDKTLIFSVGVYEKDFAAITKNFDRFEKAMQENHELISQLKGIVNLFKRNKFRNEEIAKKILSYNIAAKYDGNQLQYLASQITDYEFIKNKFNQNKIETHIELLNRMFQIDREKTFNFINNKHDLFNRHWSYIVPLFNFLRKHYDKKEIEDYIKANQESFRTSSQLKKHLKEECGIFISQKEGGLIIEIK